MIREDGDPFNPLDDALEELDAALGKWMREQGSSNKRG